LGDRRGGYLSGYTPAVEEMKLRIAVLFSSL
jgi:hypothetical protein